MSRRAAPKANTGALRREGAPANRCVLLLPGDLDTPSGGYRYDRRVVQELRGRGWPVQALSLPGAWPAPDAATLAQAEAAVAALPDDVPVIADGLAFGALPETAMRHARRLRWVALVHHPLGLETGLGAAQAAALIRDERRALAATRHVVVTSEATARLLQRLEMATARVTTIEPGCDLPALPLRRRAAEGPVQLLCVASVTARKGHLVLLEALAPLRELPWVLHNVGSLTMDPATAAAARAAAHRLGLDERVHWHGAAEATALPGHYARADLFVLPSLFEGYGMVLAEALAHGLPVVGTDTGAARSLLGGGAGGVGEAAGVRDAAGVGDAGGAGVLVPPGDAAALRAALAPLLAEPARRALLAQAALAARARLPSWAAAGARWEQVLQSVAAAPAP
ncbi:MAG: glycosyltransferase family 4 protein [Burkholderiales bacterium]|nr:glycosyltransferase family 4 protein [Burkholderiales bacterium]